MTAILIHGAVEDGNIELSAPRRRLIQKDANTFYAIFKTSTGGLGYAKSGDALATWSAGIEVDANAGLINQDAYYRRWNDRTLDDVIDLFVDSDAGDRGLFHRALDLSDDSLGTATEVQNAGSHPSVRNFGGVVADSGRLYCAGGGHLSGIDPTTEYSDDEGATWTPSSSDEFPEANSSDIFQLWPDFSSADPDDVSAIFLDASANELSVKQYDASAGTITETAIGSITYAISATNLTSSFASNGHIRVAVVDTSASPASIKTWDVYGSTVTAKTDVVTTTADIKNVAMQVIDEGDLTVVWYVRGTAVYYKVSTDQMVTWGPETLLYDPGATPRGLLADPRPPTTQIAVAWITSGEEMYTFFPAQSVDEGVEQYRLMLATTASPDVPTLNITSQNIPPAGSGVGSPLIKVVRGRESALLGRPPRAGTASVVLNNVTLGYNLDQPTPGLAIRLNKKYDGVWYHMWTGPIDIPAHEMTNFRAVAGINANGFLSKLANKRVFTPLLGRGVDAPTTTGAAINAVLDAADFPAAKRDIDTGDVTLPYFWANGEDASALLEMLVNSEGITAELYENGAGDIVFRDRTARYDETRSTDIQFTFNLHTTEPLFTGFTYASGWREVVNYASHQRFARTNDDEVTVVWADDPDNDGYIIGPNQELVFEAVGEQPFYDAVTPVLGTDYAVGFGTVSVSLDRTSGQTVNITFTAGPAGATIGQLQLRATATIVGATFQEHSGDYVDASASQALYGVRPWTGSMSKELTWSDMRDNLDAIVTWKKDPRGRVRFGLNAAREGAEIAPANEATAKLEIGDRVRIINQDLDFDGELWVERIEHEVFAPAGTADGTAVGREFTTYECSVIEVAVGSQGSGVSDTNPYDAITHEDNVLPTPLDVQGVMTRGIVASLFGAGP